MKAFVHFFLYFKAFLIFSCKENQYENCNIKFKNNLTKHYCRSRFNKNAFFSPFIHDRYLTVNESEPCKNDVANAWNDRSSVNLPHATNHSVSKWRSINRIPVCSTAGKSFASPTTGRTERESKRWEKCGNRRHIHPPARCFYGPNIKKGPRSTIRRHIQTTFHELSVRLT